MAQATEIGIIQAGVTLLLGILGAGGTIYAARGQIRKHATDANNTANQQIIDNAIALHEVYRVENETLRRRVAELEATLSDVKQALNHASQENYKLNDRIARLEKRLDTGDLTPPPHDIPADDWQDPPPLDEPPNE